VNIKVTNIELNDEGQITVYFDALNLLKDVPVTIPVQALETRKAIYDHDHDHEALDSLIRETAVALSHNIYDLDIDRLKEIDPDCEYIAWRKNVKKKVLTPQGEEALHHFGGLHDEVTIEYSSEAEQKLHPTLKSTKKHRRTLTRQEKTKWRRKALTPMTELRDNGE